MAQVHSAKQNSKTTEDELISWWMDKQNGSYPCNWILFSNKNKWNANPCYKVGDPWKLKYKWKEAVTEFYDSIHMKYSEKVTP